ncbi:AAA family ATPase [Mucilaginibacter sp.]|uniref:GumC family protein n=1 Tax=Mucilaginibacter sp. TaxID=1882438 RepID=UPI0025D3344E|nr:AAA family ATPase [Mucilaginibacter sp.]
MEISGYFKLLKKYILIIIAVVVAAVVASYFLVKNLPDEYVSRTQIATGIVDASTHLLDKDNNPNAQSDQINREFSNLMEIIKLKKLIDQVSYQLIIHDLSSSTPFRKLNHDFKGLSQAAIQHALVVYRAKLVTGAPLSLYNKDENGLNELLISMHYDERSLRKNLDIARDEESDFIAVQFTSENPQLSAFVVNTLAKEFIDYYSVNIKKNESNAVDFLSNLLEEKRNALNQKKEELQQYKIKNGILNLDDQSKTIFAQILAYTDKKLENQRTLAANEGALQNVLSKFDPNSRKYIEASINQNNAEIATTNDQLKALTDEYVHAGFDPKYKPAIDSLQSTLVKQLHTTSDKYLVDPRIGKDNLVVKAQELEVSRDLAKYSEKSINKELASLNAKFSRLVPFDATVKTYEFDIDIATKEYLDVLGRYNATNLQSKFSIRLAQVEPATPDVAQPSKKMFLIALSGMASLFLCLLVLFILYYLDDNVTEPSTLVARTNLPMLGALNMIKGPKPDLRKLWDVENRTKMQQFKELLRSVRFEIDQELKGEKVLAITSIGVGEGKTLIATSLAYAYSSINKKVLLIDGNFVNPSVTRSVQPTLFVEDYFRATSYTEWDNAKISVLGNRGADTTLLEINDEKSIAAQFEQLKSRYDIILIDLPPLDSLNNAKEWILFANKTVAVFEANRSVKNSHKEYIAYLKTLNNKFAGWILNKATVIGASKKSKN